ncbi:C-terminal binding protein [Haloarculaceae archaeon H-GB2-1]|nr:C-terminal binding protein [Haloarculaceae archaeon H-GB1-1]MEA5387879.1 C-terminal binding protein [Haloarculaceae archaeon H-GB11]MEA5409373.1 C-terminal binding protein [Haloarculaceae archaeon H-GB2-1]
MTDEVVVTDYVHGDVRTERDKLGAVGATVRSVEAESTADLLDSVEDARVLLTTRVEITADVYAAFPSLEAVIRYGSGYDNVDVDAATDYGVAVVNVPEYCSEEVATHTIGLILACDRRIVQFDREVHRGTWDPEGQSGMTRLSEKTLGIVGFGTIGRLVAERAKSFGVDLLVHSRSATQSDLDAFDAESVSFEDLLARSDVVTVHTALSDRTRHLFDRAAFETMRDGAILVNTSRGGVVDQDALVDALAADELALAGLDVLAEEPPADDEPLLDRDDVVLTPHAAWYSETATDEVQRLATEEAVRVVRGERPRNVVNPAALD